MTQFHYPPLKPGQVYVDHTVRYWDDLMPCQCPDCIRQSFIPMCKKNSNLKTMTTGTSYPENNLEGAIGKHRNFKDYVRKFNRS